MKVTYKYEQVGDGEVRLALSNGADSSTVLSVSGLVLPILSERDFASLDVFEGDEALIRAARAELVDLLATRWGMRPATWDREAVLETTAGSFRFSFSAIKVDEATGEVVLSGCRPQEYSGAFNAMNSGTGYVLGGEWLPEDRVESTIGTFEGADVLSQYRAARAAKGLSA